ncbi:MAG: diacylglycerol kinase family protein [Myxococcota bacterium]
MKTFVLVNPMSGAGRTGRLWPELRRALSDRLDDWQHDFTLGPGDGTRLAAEAVETGYEELVVVGGDGTLNEALNGLDRGDSLAPVVLTPVRFGTGGDFARHLQLSGRLPGAVSHVGAGSIRRIDVGRVQFVDLEGQPQTRLFLNIASFGMSAEVVRRVDSGGKRFGAASFGLALGGALLAWRPPRLKVWVDDEVLHDGEIVTGAVANGSHFGGGMHFARGAAVDDGLFRVVLQTKAGARELLRVDQVYSGAMDAWRTVKTADGRRVRVEVESGADVRLETDGELPGRLDAEFELLPGALQLRS